MTNVRRVPLLAIALLSAACTHPEASETSASAATEVGRPSEVSLTAEQQTDAGVTFATVAAASVPDELTVPARIALPDTQTWRVGVRTDGLVDTVNASIGDFVRRGQLLGRYHADELRDTRARYRAAIADLERARAADVLAQRNAARADTLLELKATSVQQDEAARQDSVAAGAAARSAQIEVDRLRHVLEHDLQVSADVDPDDEVADQVPIYAPASGYVLERNISPGRAVHTTDDTFLIGDPSHVWALASVREDQIDRVRLGSSAIITLPGSADQTFHGRVANIAPQADAATRTVAVRIVANNPDGRLRPEMLANVSIPIGAARETLVVPADAVQQIDEQTVVFVHSAPQRFSMRPIHVGPPSNNDVTVVQGLRSGEQIVVGGSFVLKSQILRSTIDE